MSEVREGVCRGILSVCESRRTSFGVARNLLQPNALIRLRVLLHVVPGNYCSILRVRTLRTGEGVTTIRRRLDTPRNLHSLGGHPRLRLHCGPCYPLAVTTLDWIGWPHEAKRPGRCPSSITTNSFMLRWFGQDHNPRYGEKKAILLGDDQGNSGV